MGGVDADGDQPFFLPETAIIDFIVNDDYTFFTNVGGRRANIEIEMSGTGFYHLKTVADGFVPNNLESLPHCS